MRSTNSPSPADSVPRILYGDQIASARVAGCAFVGAQLNVRTAWFYEGELHRIAAYGTRQLGRLKLGATWRRRSDFHVANFRSSVTWFDDLPFRSQERRVRRELWWPRPCRGQNRPSRFGEAVRQVVAEPSPLPLAFGFRQHAAMFARIVVVAQLAPLSLQEVLHVTLLPFMQVLQTSTH
jgi:hypothetical protein